MPKISVIVPVYKVEEYLKRCVDSVLAQTYEDFELILVDDGSPDNCPAMCDEIAKTDSRVHVIHKPNGGLSDARNAGLDYIMAHSDSEWVTFIDSDDWIHCRCLEWMYQAAQKHNAQMVIAEYCRTSAEQENDADYAENAKVCDTEQYFLENNTNAIIACAKLYLKNNFKDIRYPVGRIHEDEFTTYKLLFANPTVCVVELPLYYYYINPNSITSSRQNARYMDRVTAFEERLAFLEHTPYRKAYELTVEMYMCRLYGALDLIYTGGIHAPEDVKRLRRNIRQTRRTIVKTINEDAQKRIRLDRKRYWKHSPNRLLIRMIGLKRYERLKGGLRKS